MKNLTISKIHEVQWFLLTQSVLCHFVNLRYEIAMDLHFCCRLLIPALLLSFFLIDGFLLVHLLYIAFAASIITLNTFSQSFFYILFGVVSSFFTSTKSIHHVPLQLSNSSLSRYDNDFSCNCNWVLQAYAQI